MARLSAHGREVARIESERAGDGDLTTWERVSFAVMADRWVLRKLDARFDDGRRHSYGWKRYRKVGSVDPETVDRLVERWKAGGWKVERKLAGVVR